MIGAMQQVRVPFKFPNRRCGRRSWRVALAGVVVGLAFQRPVGAQTGLLEFMRAQSQRRYTQVPREVLAFYYTWYGTPARHGRWVHWGRVNPEQHDISQSTHYPARGAYDSDDPELIDAHIDQAKAHGLTGFIATWWGQGGFEDRAFGVVLDRAERKGFKVTIYWETAPGSGTTQIDQAVRDLVYVLRRYGRSPAFLKLDDKPVIFVYGRVMGQMPLNAWPEVIQRTRAEVGDFVLIADGYSETYARLFDGVHTYNICGWVQGKRPDALRQLSARTFAANVALAKQHARLSCLTVIPGYDDTKIRKPGLNADRQNGQTYRVLWEEAIRADPDWVLITSWNEWHEGSEIEPSWEHGDQYLKITGQYAHQFRATPFSRVPVPAAPSKLPADSARRLRELFAGRTIGLLPGYGGAAPFLLLDAGLPVRELAWADLLDARQFNARTYPVLLYAAGEHYRRTVRSPGDVEQALQRYLGQGGFLVCMPHLPWPFYYDEAVGQPAPVAARLGLPVTGGWEQPPPGASLRFELDTRALAGLPASVPFPATGDLRWRPAQRSAAPPGARYSALATLKDVTGQSLGDGIAYVELREPPLQGGKTLYVWMRMAEVLGGQPGLVALWQFVGEKLGRP